MVLWDTEVPQMFVIVIFTEHNFRDMVIPPFISLKPTSQWMALATLSCLLLYSFCASVAHELTIWLMMMIHYCNKQMSNQASEIFFEAHYFKFKQRFGDNI